MIRYIETQRALCIKRAIYQDRWGGLRGGCSDSAAPPGRPLGVVSTGRHDRWHHRLSDRPPRFVTPHLARTSNSNKLECFKTALTDFEHTPRRRRRIANVTVGSGADFFQSRCGSCLVRMIREFVRWKVISISV